MEDPQTPKEGSPQPRTPTPRLQGQRPRLSHLVGEFLEGGTITDSSFSGNVSDPDGDYVGGLVGEQVSGGPGADPIAVSNSYASVDLHGGSTAVGGLVGEGESTALEASFWQSGLATAGALSVIGGALASAAPPPAQQPPAQPI